MLNSLMMSRVSTNHLSVAEEYYNQFYSCFFFIALIGHRNDFLTKYFTRANDNNYTNVEHIVTKTITE